MIVIPAWTLIDCPNCLQLAMLSVVDLGQKSFGGSFDFFWSKMPVDDVYWLYHFDQWTSRHSRLPGCLCWWMLKVRSWWFTRPVWRNCWSDSARSPGRLSWAEWLTERWGLSCPAISYLILFSDPTKVLRLSDSEARAFQFSRTKWLEPGNLYK